MSREYWVVAAIVLIVLSTLFFLKGAAHKTEHKMEMSAGVVTIVAKDYAFDAPASIPAGITTFKFTNKGKELHHALLVKIGESHTFEELLAGLKQPQAGPPPAWISESGGVNAVFTGDSATATVSLEPGQYALICEIPGADGVPHFAKGMVKSLTVTATNQPVVVEPVADITMKLYDYGFELSTPITAGKHTIRVENAGPQTHEVEFVQFVPGTTLQDFVNWAQKEQGPPPPVKWLGGFAPTSKGNHGWITMDFAPGEYGLLCFLPDQGDDKAHIVHGMAQSFTVK
ncbi:hypothetical protein HY230_07035 [Candidatus Acetothermia bacterium]|nr:hypothetical protein [Candidatus Acetothermia bacterium]